MCVTEFHRVRLCPILPLVSLLKWEESDVYDGSEEGRSVPDVDYSIINQKPSGAHSYPGHHIHPAFAPSCVFNMCGRLDVPSL